MPTWIASLVRQRWGRGARSGDPFATLEVQFALARLERELAELRGGGRRDFAQAHHLRAAMIAYDQVLTQACRLAGVGAVLEGRRMPTARPGEGPPDPTPMDEVTRVLVITALQAQGWRW